MAIREQIGILLIALMAGFVATSLLVQRSPSEPIERMGLDLPAAVYAQRPTEASNRFRVSLLPRRDLERVEMRFYWLRSREIPNSTTLGPKPKTDWVGTLLLMTEIWTADVLIEADVIYNGSKARMVMYDFGIVPGAVGGDVGESPTCFAFILGIDGSVLGYFEGRDDFFPFSGKTVQSLRLTSGGVTRIFEPSPSGQGGVPPTGAPIHGTWTVDKPRRDEVLEFTALLVEDARVRLATKWGVAEKMQVLVLDVNGEGYRTWVEFT